MSTEFVEKEMEPEITQEMRDAILRRKENRARASRVITLLDYVMENHDKVFDYWLEGANENTPKVVVQIPYEKKKEFLI